MSIKHLEAEANHMTANNSQRLIALPLFVVALFSSVAFAAGPTTPGQALQSVQPPRAIPIDQTVQLPELVGNAAHPAQVAPGGTPIKVASVDFIGNTKISTATLQARTAKLIGTSLTLAELYAEARELTRFYQSQGYPLASVNVPVQRVADGKVLLEVVEGRVGKIRIEGQRYYQSKALEAQFSELPTGEVLTSAALERELLLLNDLPGITARVVITPGVEAGTSDLIVKIEEDAFAFYASGDNYGRQDIGEYRGSFNIDINGMGRGDQLSLNMTHSEGGLLDYGRIAYSLPVGTDGGRFTASYLTTDYRVGDPAFALLDPQGSSYTSRGEYTYPLVRSRNANKVLSVAVTGTQTETIALGVVTDTSEILLLELALFGNQVFGDRRTSSWSLGYSGNGKFNDGNRDNEQCCKIFGDYSFTVPVGEAWYTKTKIRGAWAPDQLADVERFSIGGPYSVRGYASSELRGDTGFDGAVELHRPMNFLGGNADLLFFGDVGQVVSNTTAGAVESDVLAAIGVGFTAFNIYGFECHLTVARAVGNYDAADGEGGRAFLSIGTRF